MSDITGDNPARREEHWLSIAVVVLAGIQLAHLVVHWLRYRTLVERKDRSVMVSRHDQPASPSFDAAMLGAFTDQSAAQDENLDSGSLHPTNPIVHDMYLEITNISQALTVGLLVYVLVDSHFYASLADVFYSPPVFALASLIITIIFWTRFYFDTEILNRSYSVFSTVLFFMYGVAQGASVSYVTSPLSWLVATGALLFFGFGFYACNLAEMRRKRKANILPIWPNFLHWQRKRMIELLVLSLLSFGGAFLVLRHPSLALPEAIIALLVSLWQAGLTGEYRRFRFLKTGI